MKFACTVPLFALAAILHAENCTLKGVAISEDGTPAPGLEVSAGNFSMFHGSNAHSTKTGPDGTFSFPALPCGKYMLNVRGFDPDAQFPRFVTVDIKKQPLIQLKVPNVDPLASLLYVPSEKDPDAAPATVDLPPKSTTISEDPAISRQRREYFQRISPRDLAAFEAAPLTEQKKMYSAAVQRYMAEVVSGGPANLEQPQSVPPRRRSVIVRRGPAAGADDAAPRVRHAEQDSVARGRLAYAAAIVRDALSPDDANAFTRAPEIEQARMFLRAVQTLHHAPGCGMYAFFLADLDEVSPGTHALSAFAGALDEPSAIEQWAALDTRGRCALMDRFSLKMLEIARGLEADGSIENVKSAHQRTGSHVRGPKWDVLEMFGNAGLARYEEARAVDRKLEIYRAALLMTLCWSVALWNGDVQPR
jgi:hypothetical protein